MSFTSDPTIILSSLIRCPSVTSSAETALPILEDMLKSLGFLSEIITFREEGYADVHNLYAYRDFGQGSHLMFAGHTDVVPAGNEEGWIYPPFSGSIHNGLLYGRGAVDMKGAIACFIAAVSRYFQEGGEIKGSLSFLITSDEEGEAINGTEKLLKWAKEKGFFWDACLVGEPTNSEKIGDTIKVGRRGSLSGGIIVYGTQSHVAYEDARCNNPIRILIPFMNALLSPLFDKGNDHFPATNLEIVSVDVGNTTLNMIPAKASACFNVRFNNLWTSETLKEEIKKRLDSAAKMINQTRQFEKKIMFDLEWYGRPSESFLTNNTTLADKFALSVKKVIGICPEYSTLGGTSDARFIKKYCPVVEFGLVSKTAHTLNENVSLKDLETLTDIYKNFLADWFS